MENILKNENIDKGEVFILKGEELMDMMDMVEAEKCIKIYLQLNPDSQRAYRDLMNIYYETGEFENSLLYCNKLLKMDVSDPLIFERKAYLLACLDEIDEALECYDKAIALKPDFYQAICDKAQLLEECGCHKESLETYEKGMKISPEKGTAYLGAAFAYQKLGDKKKAFELSEKAYNSDPEDEFFKCHYTIMKELRYAE